MFTVSIYVLSCPLLTVMVKFFCACFWLRRPCRSPNLPTLIPRKSSLRLSEAHVGTRQGGPNAPSTKSSEHASALSMAWSQRINTECF